MIKEPSDVIPRSRPTSARRKLGGEDLQDWPDVVKKIPEASLGTRDPPSGRSSSSSQGRCPRKKRSDLRRQIIASVKNARGRWMLQKTAA